MLSQVKSWSSMIKIEHTIFSLPFALSAALLGLQTVDDFNPWVFLWIFICLLGARSAGMTLNRIIDAEIDAKNPRTADREIPKGTINKTQAWAFTILSFALLIFGAFQLPKLCQLLLPIPVIWLWIYPYLKRFTWFCHFFLGITLGGATLGGWIAITGSVNSLAPIYLALAVSSWVAGFDIIYSCQDYEHDKQNNIHSIPVKFGLKGALQISKFMHVLTPLMLYMAGDLLNLGIYYKLAILFSIIALFYEQKLVNHKDLTQVDKAFFTVNSWISVAIFAFVLLEVLL